MPKMKSKRALMKRIKVTGSGKVVRHHAYVSHLAPHKTTKQKRQRIKLRNRRRRIPVIAIVIKPKPNLCAGSLRRLDTLREKLIVLILRILQKIQL